MTVFELALGIAFGYAGGMLIAALLQAAINTGIREYLARREMKKFNEAIAKLNENSAAGKDGITVEGSTRNPAAPQKRTAPRKKTGNA